MVFMLHQHFCMARTFELPPGKLHILNIASVINIILSTEFSISLSVQAGISALANTSAQMTLLVGWWE